MVPLVPILQIPILSNPFHSINGARLLGVEPPVDPTIMSWPCVNGIKRKVLPIQAEFGIDVTLKPMAVPRRVLAGPNVWYNGSKTAMTRLASWNINEVEFSTTSKLPSWTYLLLSSLGVADVRGNWGGVSCHIKLGKRTTKQTKECWR